MTINYHIPKLPPPYCCGSVNRRRYAASKLYKQIFENMYAQYEQHDSCHIIILRDILNEFFQGSTRIIIKDLSLKKRLTMGGYTKIKQKGNKAIEFEVGVPFDKFYSMDILSFPAFMHEIRHVIGYLVNPKYLICHLKFSEKHMKTTKIENFYWDRIYKKEKVKTPDAKRVVLESLERDLRELLSQYTYSKQIVSLNNIRYSMQQEIDAYEIEYKIIQKLKKRGKLHNLDLSNFRSKTECMFKDKLEIVNKILGETIQNARNNSEVPQKRKNIIEEFLSRLFGNYDE